MSLYAPSHFVEPEADAIRGLVAAYPLATLVTVGDSEVAANHLPLLWTASGVAAGNLRGHVARANPVWKAHVAANEVLAIFHGPNSYISPSWLATKKENGKVVPTWNYQVVHMYGRARFIDDLGWLRQLVDDLTARHEAPRPQPWHVDDAPEDYIAAMLHGIIGVEIEVTRVIAKWKNSQNRSDADRQAIADGLSAEDTRDAGALASDLRRRLGATPRA